MKRIPLTQGKFATVDDEDYDWLNQWNWCVTQQENRFYAVRQDWRNGKSHIIRMHREILRPENGLWVDHWDNNGLNNQRANLRAATPSQNQQNARPSRNGTSRYKGVCWAKKAGKWAATIELAGKQINIGYFADERKAAKAYDKKARQLFGGFAYLNFLNHEGKRKLSA